MTTPTEPQRLLVDLPNLATRLAYEELSSSLFIPSTDCTSQLEVCAPAPIPTIATEQRCSARPENNVRATRNLMSQSCGTTTCADDCSGENHSKLSVGVFKTVEELKAHTSVPRAFRAFFIRKRNSYSTLLLSQSLFDQLCADTGIPQLFQDYLVYFGRKEHEVEIAPPPFSSREIISTTGSEGPRWQMMGIIRFVEANGRQDVPEPSMKWSLRQTAIFCSFNQNGSSVLWLFVAISGSAERLVTSLWSSQQAITSPVPTLYALYHFAVCNWRPYVVALVCEFEQHEMGVLGFTPDDKGPVPMADSGERQALLVLEKKILTAKLAIQATKADLEFLRYELQRPTPSYTEFKIDREDCDRRFSVLIRDLDINLKRVEDLYARLQGITTLVSSFLALSSDHALRVLTQESKTESENMRRLNERMADLAEKNAEEAVTVTVLALLTLIYLPLTVVSNFFSTSFVGVDDNHIFVTRDWWILFVVAVPLTALTLYVWWIWAKVKAKGRYPIWWTLLGLKKTKRAIDLGPP